LPGIASRRFTLGTGGELWLREQFLSDVEQKWLGHLNGRPFSLVPDGKVKGGEFACAQQHGPELFPTFSS